MSKIRIFLCVVVLASAANASPTLGIVKDAMNGFKGLIDFKLNMLKSFGNRNTQATTGQNLDLTNMFAAPIRPVTSNVIQPTNGVELDFSNLYPTPRSPLNSNFNPQTEKFNLDFSNLYPTPRSPLNSNFNPQTEKFNLDFSDLYTRPNAPVPSNVNIPNVSKPIVNIPTVNVPEVAAPRANTSNRKDSPFGNMDLSPYVAMLPEHTARQLCSQRFPHGNF